jgi:hypothetical protein
MLFQPRGSSRRAVSRLRPSRLGLRLYPAGSPRLKTESSSSRTDRSFASRCSPPRLTATQLRSALVNEHLTRQDFHLSDRVRFSGALGRASSPEARGRPRPSVCARIATRTHRLDRGSGRDLRAGRPDPQPAAGRPGHRLECLCPSPAPSHPRPGRFDELKFPPSGNFCRSDS